jgi:rSAM/selenodomain-associated transferase 2
VKISVIIPAIDEACVIGQAIQSAHQAGASEIIVADGGSRDSTCQTAESLGARVVTSEPGRAIQQNSGSRAASGDVLLFLHADCQLPASGLDELQEALKASPLSVGGFFRQRIEHPGRMFRFIEAGNLLRARSLKWAYGDQGIFVRSTVFADVGGFPQIAIMEDLYLMKRLKRCGRLACINAPLVVSARRWQARGLVRQTLRNWCMLAAAHLGISPSVLAHYYPRAT